MTTPQPTTPDAPPREQRHALDCTCPACGMAVSQDARKPENEDPRAVTRLVDFEVPVQEGDHVWVEEGTYRGCILTLLKIERTQTVTGGREIIRYVCRRSSYPEEIRTKRVSLYRRWPPVGGSTR